MLRRRNPGCEVLDVVGTELSPAVREPDSIYITSLFTWDLDTVTKTIHFYQDRFPRSRIRVGGIAASLLPEVVREKTGLKPHVGLLKTAERHPPDYSLTFGREISASMTQTTRGCPRRCRFCNVGQLEPEFAHRGNWKRDVLPQHEKVILWDNNFLASPHFPEDCDELEALGKIVDFNQGLDARLYSPTVAARLSRIRLRPIRFAFDELSQEKHVLKAIDLARKHSSAEIRVYVLYNFQDTPEDFYYRVNLLNSRRVLAFPMEYRQLTDKKTKFPGPHWDSALLRGLKLSLMYYYRRGMITESRRSFHSIYGRTPKCFIDKLYEIYDYDRSLKRHN